MHHCITFIFERSSIIPLCFACSIPRFNPFVLVNSLVLLRVNALFLLVQSLALLGHIAKMQSLLVPISQDADRCKGGVTGWPFAEPDVDTWAPWNPPGYSMIYLHHISVSFRKWSQFEGSAVWDTSKRIQTSLHHQLMVDVGSEMGKFLLDFGMGIWHHCRQGSATLQSHLFARLYVAWRSCSSWTRELRGSARSASCRNVLCRLGVFFKCFLMNHWDVPNLSEFSWKIFGRCHNYDLNARLLIPIKLEGEAPQPRLDGKASVKLRRMHRNIFGKGLKNVETTNQYDTV